MRYSEILSEGVVVHGVSLAAYAYVVAEEYSKLPTFQSDQAYRWVSLAAHDDLMMSRIASDVAIELVDDDPYKTMQEMAFDIFKNKRMKVYRTKVDDNQEGSHPQFSPEENNTFRAVHDIIGHYGPNAKAVAKYIIDNNITDEADTKLKGMKFNRNKFSVRGEINTYVTHSVLLPREAIPALYTEVVGQICTYFTTNNFAMNKVAVFNGVDFKNIGRFTDIELTKRMNRYIELLNDPEVDSFDLQGLDITVTKSKIRWGLLGSPKPKNTSIV